jgi:hypothetical protein
MYEILVRSQSEYVDATLESDCPKVLFSLVIYNISD